MTINWDTSGDYPQIEITKITINSSVILGIWEATFSLRYVFGLIPLGSDTELNSSLAGPQGDIYSSLTGSAGNPIMTATAASVPPGMEDFLYGSFGDFTFSAAVVPVAPAVWLFGSGLIGLIGVARRKKS